MILTVDNLLWDHSSKIVEYYYQVESDIRRICEPHFHEVTHDDITKAQVDAAHALMQYLPLDMLSAHLLANMFFENTYCG